MPFKSSIFRNNRSQASLVSQEQPGSRNSIVASPLPSPPLQPGNEVSLDQLASPHFVQPVSGNLPDQSSNSHPPPPPPHQSQVQSYPAPQQPPQPPLHAYPNPAVLPPQHSQPPPLSPDDNEPDPYRYYNHPAPPTAQASAAALALAHQQPQSYTGVPQPAAVVDPAGPPPRPSGPTAEDPPPSYGPGPVDTVEAAPDPEPRRSKRSFFGLGPTLRSEARRSVGPEVLTANPTASQGNTAGLGRRISLRRRDPPPGLRQSRLSPIETSNQQEWANPTAVDHPLPPAPEEDEAERVDGFAAAKENESFTVSSQASVVIDHPSNYPASPEQETAPAFGTHPHQPAHLDAEAYYLEPQRQASLDVSLPSRQQSVDSNLSLPTEPSRHMQQNPGYQAYQPSQGEGSTGRLSPEDHRRLGQASQASYQHSQQQQPPQAGASQLQQLPSQAQQAQQSHQAPQQQQQQQQQQQGQQHSAPQFQAYNSQSSSGPNRLQKAAPAHSRQSSMAPPTSDPSRSVENSGHGGGGGRDGAPVVGLAPASQIPSQPPTPGRAQFGATSPGGIPPGAAGRGGAGHPSGAAASNVSEHDRTSPQPSRAREDLPSVEGGVHQELQAKYSKVKKLYFDKLAQVEQLQNTLAHQRLSQSRTCLDDNEYATRFNRLDGAINNLAFNIRKDWGSVPPWLQPVINRDAHVKGTKEMTVVGRACISRWIVEEVLDRYFHPGIEPGLSSQLKIIEKNIRRLAAPAQSLEEEDALLAKVSNWRLTTADGLQDALATTKSAEYRAKLTQTLTRSLIAALTMMLNDPPPPDLEGGVAMIIELAVGIAANMPLESRDVFVNYPSPGTLVTPETMKVESGLPGLAVSPAEAEAAEADRSSLSGAEASSQVGDGKDQHSLSELRDPDGASLKDQAPKKRGMLQGFLGKKPGPNQGLEPGPKAAGSVGVQGGASGAGPRPNSPAERKDEVQRVRVAAFMSVEVRGRSVLVKAPVWSL